MLIELKIKDKKSLKKNMLLMYDGEAFVPVDVKDLRKMVQEECRNNSKVVLEQYNMDKKFEKLEQNLEKRINGFIKAFVGRDDNDV